MTHRVESIEPETLQIDILAPKLGSLGIGGFGNQYRDGSADDINTESHNSTLIVTHSVGNNDTDNHSAEVGKVVCDERLHADLLDDIVPSVDTSRADTLCPNDKYKSNVVGPAIDTSEQVVAEFSAIGQREEERNQHGACDDEDTVPFGLGIHDKRDNGVEHGESGTVTQHHKSEEEHDSPEVGGRQLNDGFWQSHETDREGSNRVLRIRAHTQEAHDTEDGKSGNVLEKNVACNDHERVNHSIRVLLVVRGIGREVTETNASREEHLTTSCLPKLTLGQLSASPGSKIQLDALTSIGERARSTNQNDSDDDRETHGEVDNTTGETSATEDGDPHEKPGEDTPANCLSIYGSAHVLNPAGDCASIVAVVARNGFRVVVDDRLVELGSATSPREGAGERVSEIDHDPGKIDDEVRADDETDVQHGETGALETVVDTVVCDDATATVGIADGDFEDKDGNGDEEDAHEVRDVPLQAVIVVDYGWVTQQVSHTSATTHGSKDERGARRPLVATILGQLGRRRNSVDNSLAHALGAELFHSSRSIGNFLGDVGEAPAKILDGVHLGKMREKKTLLLKMT